MEWLLILSAVGSVVVFGFSGLLLWARAEVPLIWREIAINTRATDGPEYQGVQALAVLMKVIAVLLVVIGLTGAGILIAIGLVQ